MSLACPWAHRTLIFRKLKGLEDMISVSVVNHFMGSSGWTFHEGDGVIDVNNTGTGRLAAAGATSLLSGYCVCTPRKPTGPDG